MRNKDKVKKNKIKSIVFIFHLSSFLHGRKESATCSLVKGQESVL